MSQRRWRMAAAVVVAGLGVVAAAAVAQPPSPRRSVVNGRVLRPAADSAAEPVPAPGVWVTLHRVGADRAGALDSTRAAADGGFHIAYPRSDADSAVFFVSASYGGITYFSPPLAAGVVAGDEVQLVVYDTTTARSVVQVQGRHVIVGSIDSTRRHPVVEVYELGNAAGRTLVSDRDQATWSAPVPARAQDVRLSGAEISPQAVSVDSAGAHLFAPIAPGLKQVSLSYALPPTAFPLDLAVSGGVELLEVLVEDPAATVDGATLAAADTIAIEGRTFRRFVAGALAAPAALRITIPAPPADRRSLYVTVILILLGMLMLLAFGRSVRRPAPLALGWNGELGPSPEEIARRIAALDGRMQRRRDVPEEERLAYERQRQGLKAQLTEAMLRHGGEG